MSADESALKELFRTMPFAGRLCWIGVRPSKGAPLQARMTARAAPEDGLEGDRFDGGRTRQRQVTLIQAEHLLAVAGILHRPTVEPELTRRNLVVSGINLRALMRARFRIGSVVLEGTCECPPCSQMERNLGPGGYNAMRGHGGICAQVVQAGVMQVDDPVEFIALLEEDAGSKAGNLT